MRKIVLSACLYAWCVPGLAANSDIIASNNQVGFAYLSTRVDYTETGSGLFGTPTGILDTETGPVPGMGFSLSTMRGPGHDYVQVEFDQASGSTTYTGAYMGGTFGSVVASSSATLTDFGARFGKGFELPRLMFTPYVEVGRHEWDRGVNYGEIYTHNYVGFGALGQYSPVDKLVLSANAMLARTFMSYIVVNSGPGLNGFSGSLGNSLLTRVGVSADYAFSGRLHGSMAVDYTTFKYGMSAVYSGMVNGANVQVWEPDSKTHYTRIKIGIGIGF